MQAAVVSAPCFDLFRQQPSDYRAKFWAAPRASAWKPPSKATGRAGSVTKARSWV